VGSVAISAGIAPVTFEPVKRETVMDTVARRIESLIRSGELKVGSVLPPEPKLAAMLGVSRNSLREALKSLVFLGLIKARPGYGTYVQPTLGRAVTRHFEWMLLLHEIKYLEIYELRKILEPPVAALAARRASKDDIEKMTEAIREMRGCFARPDQYMAAEMAFHEAFTQAAKNVATQTMLRMMYGALAEGRRRVLPLISDIQQNFKRHERIFKCIAKRDAKSARKAVLDDLRYSESLLRKDLEMQEQVRAHMQKPGRAAKSKKRNS
jgi:GntR family transcriptional repressor for pyruvate dehydrogenase complex